MAADNTQSCNMNMYVKHGCKDEKSKGPYIIMFY